MKYETQQHLKHKPHTGQLPLCGSPPCHPGKKGIPQGCEWQDGPWAPHPDSPVSCLLYPGSHLTDEIHCPASHLRRIAMPSVSQSQDLLGNLQAIMKQSHSGNSHQNGACTQSYLAGTHWCVVNHLEDFQIQNYTFHSPQT